MRYSIKGLIITCLLLLMSFIFSMQAMAAKNTNAEITSDSFTSRAFTIDIIRAGKSDDYVKKLPSDDKKQLYVSAIKGLISHRNPTFSDIENIVDGIVFDTQIIPSSNESTFEWEEITRLLTALDILAIHPAFTAYYKLNKVKLSNALANVAFTINVFPEKPFFWKTEAGKAFTKLISTLSDYHQATTDIEDTAFGHELSVLDNCENQHYLHQLFLMMSSKDNNWITTARLTHFVMRYLNDDTSKNEPLLHERDAIATPETANSFLANADNIAVVKQAIKSLIKKSDNTTLAYWRFKAMEYTASIIYILEKDYNMPVTSKWLTREDKSILSHNAKLFDWAITVEGLCPSVSLTISGEAECFVIPRKPKDSNIISAVKIWHEGDIHTTSLYPTSSLIILSRRLSLLADLDYQELMLKEELIPLMDYTRRQSESKMVKFKFIEKMF